MQRYIRPGQEEGRQAEKDGTPVTSPHQAHDARSRFAYITVLARDIPAGGKMHCFCRRQSSIGEPRA